LLALQARGYTIVGDTARAVIQDRRRRGLSPRPEPYAFAEEVLQIDVENFVHHVQAQAPSSLSEVSLMPYARWIKSPR